MLLGRDETKDSACIILCMWYQTGLERRERNWISVCQGLKKGGRTFRDNDVFIIGIIRHGLYVKNHQLYIYCM